MGSGPIANLKGSTDAAGTKFPQHVQIVDSSGNVISTFGGSGGTSQADRTAFADGTGTLTPIGAVYNETPTDPTEDQVAAPRITAKRGLHCYLVDANGNAATLGGGTQYTEGDTDTTITGTALMFEVNTTTSALAVVSATDPLPVSDAGGSLTVDNAGLTELAAAIDTEVQCDIVGALPAGTNAIGKLAANSGVDIGDVDVTSVIPGTGATNLGKAIDAAGGATDTGVAALVIRDDALGALTPIEGDYVALRVDANGALWTHDDALDAALAGSELQVDIVGSLPAGTNAIGKLAANSGVDIGDVDVTSLPNIHTADFDSGAGTDTKSAVGLIVAASGGAAVVTGDTTNGLDVDVTRVGGNVTVIQATASNLNVMAVGSVADDAGSSGDPIMVGGFAISPDGTDPGYVSAEADAAKFRTDLNRRVLINDEHPQWWSYHADGSSALTDATVQAAPGASFQVVITDIIFSNGSTSAINMFLEEGASKIFGPIYLEAINGRGFVWKGKKHVTANTAVTVTTSGAVAHAVDILGYIQRV